jgi:lipopolysaccharide/colanic/teichoic acid biosynthesis glycosyltransferase
MMTFGYPPVKRAIDVGAALPALVALSPVLLVAALLVRRSSPGPVLFRQARLGYRGRVFTLYKLRTMTDRPRVAHAEIRAGNPEVTPAGAVLRRFKIDELPQLLNVVRGDMSLVGPRPALPAQLAEYTPLALRRLEVRPGLTGLAQVNGNIALSWPERWAYDARYVDELSLALDLRILLRTLGVLLRGEQAYWRAPADG